MERIKSLTLGVIIGLLISTLRMVIHIERTVDALAKAMQVEVEK